MIFRPREVKQPCIDDYGGIKEHADCNSVQPKIENSARMEDCREEKGMQLLIKYEHSGTRWPYSLK